MAENVNYSGGVSLGSIIALILSWTTWHSVGWAILHALLGWCYVIYWLCIYLHTAFDHLSK